MLLHSCKFTLCHLQELESFYRGVHTADAGAAPGIAAEVQLPPAYPTGVLLGCVEVADVLTVRGRLPLAASCTVTVQAVLQERCFTACAAWRWWMCRQ